MDDTQQSRASDAAALATRKRRSSILKSQRPPRIPFSELEFNIATPTDTAKSRRVSFSSRTDVAEFISNEATTTWKTFYEEHNKSLESSGNNLLAIHPPKQTVDHAGTKLFEKQFQEVEADDFMTPIESHSARIVNTSLNKVNFTQQLASLECTGGDKTLLAPLQNLEMSSFTDLQTNIFSEDLAIPTTVEASDRIDVNFSAIQSIGSSEMKDDLDQMQEDLQRVKSNVFCPGPFNGRADLSEYIEVDLIATHVSMKNDVFEMSITDTIKSPKVQHLTKNNSLSIDSNAYEKDWVADKENIAVVDGCSPPVEPQKKNKTIVYENNSGNVSIVQAVPVNKILSQTNEVSLKRRTIVYESADISTTQAVPDNIVLENRNNVKRKTIIYENETGNLSITQAIPKSMILPDKSNTIKSGDDFGNMSVTQAIPIAEIITNNSVPKVYHNSVTTEGLINVPAEYDNQRTIIYGNESIDVTNCNNMTKIMSAAVENSVEPQSSNGVNNVNFEDKSIKEMSNISISAKKSLLGDNLCTESEIKQSILDDMPPEIKSILNDTNNTKVLIQNKNSEKRQTIVYVSDSADISVTRAVPVNIVLVNKDKENRKTINESVNISVTQAMPNNIIILNKSFPAEDNMDISLTETIPVAKIISNEAAKSIVKVERNSIVPCTDNDRQITIIFGNAATEVSQLNNMSMTKPISAMLESHSQPNVDELMGKITKKFDIKNELRDTTPKCKSNLPYGNAISNKSSSDKRKTIVSEEDLGNLSITQAIPIVKLITNNIEGASKPVFTEELISSMPDKTDKRGTIIYGNESLDMSVTTENSPSTSQHSPSTVGVLKKIHTKNESLGTGNDVTSEIDSFSNSTLLGEISRMETIIEEELTSVDIPTEIKSMMTDSSNIAYARNLSVLTKSKLANKRRTIVFENDLADLSVTQAVPVNVVLVEGDKGKRKSIICNEEAGNILMNTNMADLNKAASTSLRDNIHKEKDIINVSFPRTIPIAEIISDEVTFKSLNTEVTNLILPCKAHESLDKSEINNMSITEPLGAMIDMHSPPNVDALMGEIIKKIDIQNESVSEIETNAKDDISSDENAVAGNISGIIRKNIEQRFVKDVPDKTKSQVREYLNATISVSVSAPAESDISEKRKTRVYESDSAYMSVTQAVPNLMLENNDKEKHTTIVCDNETTAQANSAHIIPAEKNKTKLFQDDSAAFTEMQTIPSHSKSMQIQADLMSSSQIDINIEESNSSVAMTSILANKCKDPIDDSSCKITFEDKLASEINSTADIQSSPLKKTAFGDISDYKESKAKVIPSYLKDVSDDLKALITDLAKPNADVISFSTIDKSKDIPEIPSTCSTQIQANLITSSQIDINVDVLNSASSNIGNIPTPSSPTTTKSLKSSMKSPKIVSLPGASLSPKLAAPNTTIYDKVIVFDHNNPLNNVLFLPPECSNILKYEPRLDEKNEDKVSETTLNKESVHNGKIVTQYNVENVTFSRVDGKDKIHDMNSSLSVASKSVSVPENDRIYELKDTQVNTVIAMKDNKDLLEISSSLILVDDAAISNNFIKDNASEKPQLPSGEVQSPVHIIYQNNEEEFHINKSSISTSNGEIKESRKHDSRAKKRIYSPTKRSEYEQSGRTSVNITPKQISKMQRLTTSPNPYKAERCAEFHLEKESAGNEMDVDTSLNDISESKVKNKNDSPQKTRPGSNITVQQLVAEYDMQENIDQDALHKNILVVLSKSGKITNNSTVSESSKSPEMVISFTSSKNQIEMQDACSVTTVDTKSSAQSARSLWSTNPKVNKDLVPVTDSSDNVVAKINMLPFIGNYECEWEKATSDTWTFRLLHGRLRLTVRLAHRLNNATRTIVRSETPVLSIQFDTVFYDVKRKVQQLSRRDIYNKTTQLTVRFAVEAMRRHAACGCSQAGGIVFLLRRCAAVARLAIRWRRALCDAQFRLACRLQDDQITLKVASLPLCSVWKVTMRVQLMTDKDVIFPHASDIHVTAIVSDKEITEGEINELLATVPRDWGHVPRTIWKIFKYLKNMT